jgi:predicted Fe-S protein YdhL (DUF1289 family)
MARAALFLHLNLRATPCIGICFVATAGSICQTNPKKKEKEEKSWL